MSFFRELKARKEVYETIAGLPGIRPEGVLLPKIEWRCSKETHNSKPIFEEELEEWNSEAVKWSSEHCMAVLVIRDSCNTRYGSLKAHLQNQHDLGKDE